MKVKTSLLTATDETDMYVPFIEQKDECIIRYFGRPCDEFAERVWPIKIYDGARVTLFNKGLVSWDVIQSYPSICFLILLFEWEYASFMMISCIFWNGPRNSWVFYLNYAVHIYANTSRAKVYPAKELEHGLRPNSQNQWF
jgi:hypothetical protein